MFHLCRDAADERGATAAQGAFAFAVWRRSGATWALVALSSVHCSGVSWEGLAYD